jgi:hypothetical protein
VRNKGKGKETSAAAANKQPLPHAKKNKPPRQEEGERKHSGSGNVVSHDDSEIVIADATWNSDLADTIDWHTEFMASTWDDVDQTEPEPVSSALEISFHIIQTHTNLYLHRCPHSKG